MRAGRQFCALLGVALFAGFASAQPVGLTQGREPIAMTPAKPEPAERTFPINFATALQLAGSRPIDIQVAERQVTIAARQLERAKMLWLPNITFGADYFKHEGSQQDFPGNVVRSERGTAMVGFGPNVVFNLSDAIYSPLAAKQDLRSRRAGIQAATNDSTFAVAEAYFSVQQARGELGGALLAASRAEEVAKKAEALPEGLAPPLEVSRAKVELARRQQAATAARGRWRTASAELSRLLRLEPGTLIEPMEPPFLSITVVADESTLDALIPLGLTNRPELQGQHALVQATLTRLKQEKIRPLVPSLALRSAATNPGGSLAYGGYAGGTGDSLPGSGSRFDIDVQVLWEFQSLGFGNRARVGEKQAEHQIATLELFRTQDRIAAEISAAHAQTKAAAERRAQAEPALKEALVVVEKSLQGMAETRKFGAVDTLVLRPQEVVAAVAALGQANADFYSAVGDYNRAQFRLYRALGHPAQSLANPPKAESLPTATPAPSPIPSTLPPIEVPKAVEGVGLVAYRPTTRTDWPPIAQAMLKDAPKNREFVEQAIWVAPATPLQPQTIAPVMAPILHSEVPRILPPPLDDSPMWMKPANPKK